jgi:hypothetical protein
MANFTRAEKEERIPNLAGRHNLARLRRSQDRPVESIELHRRSGAINKELGLDKDAAEEETAIDEVRRLFPALAE